MLLGCTNLIEDEIAELPLGAVSCLLVQITLDRMVVAGALRQHDQLYVVDADRPLHLGAQHGAASASLQLTCEQSV